MSDVQTAGSAPVIDFHVHMLERSVFAASTNKTVFTGFGATPAEAPRHGVRQAMERSFDPLAIIEDLQARGIDMGVLTASTVLQGSSWADPATDLDLCRRCNDQAARWQADHPQQLVGSFLLPLQAPELAMGEFRRCVDELGLRVGNVSSSYRGVYVGAPAYHDFWQAVEAAGVTVWIHPEGAPDPWFQQFALWNSLGQSIEEAKCMASMIYEGVMTKFPALKVVMAHGGGYFPHYMGRLDRNTQNRPDTVRNTDGRKPSEFLRHFHYDTCVYDPQVLQVLAQRVGTDRLVMGSDYPVGERDPLGWLRECGLTGDDLTAVAGGNAARLLGLATNQ